MRQSKVHNDVLQSFGPADPTIIVTAVEDGTEASHEFDLDIEPLLERLGEYGNIVLVR